MVWSKSLNNKFAKIQPKEEEKKQDSSFYDNYKARSGGNNNSVSFTPSVKAKTGGSTESSTVSKQSGDSTGSSKKAAPTTVLGNDTKYFKGFQSYQDRKKTGNVFTPSTVLGKHNSGFNLGTTLDLKSAFQKQDVKLEGLSDNLNSRLNHIVDEYKNIGKTKRGMEYNRAVENLISSNRDVLSEYTSRMGRTANLPDIIYQFDEQKKKDWQNKLDAGYQKRLDNYYNTINAKDFEKYTTENTSRFDMARTPSLKKANKIEQKLSNLKLIPYSVLNEESGMPTYYTASGEAQSVVTGDYDNPTKIYNSRQVNYDDVKLLYMTDDEKQIYKYYLNKYGQENADKFLKDIGNILDERAMTGFYTKQKQAAANNKIAGAGTDIIAALRSGSAIIDTGKQAFRQWNSTPNEYIPYNPYSDATATVHAQSAAREGITQDMSGFSKAATDLGLSIGENIARLPLGAAGLPIMGASVAGQTAVNRGLNGETNAGKAFATGTAYGAVEIATEKLPLDNILKVVKAPPSTMKKAVITLLKNAGVEAGEEAISNIADNVADQIINGDTSEYSRYVKQLQEQGYSADRAAATAFANMYLLDTLTSAGQGALSGLIINTGSMATGAAINNYNDTVNTGREFRDMGEVQSVIDTGKASDNNTSAYKYANRLQQKQSRGADLSDWNIGRQYQKNVRAIQSENEFAAAMSNIKPTEITDSLFNDAGQELNGMASESGVRVSTNGNQDIPTSIKHEWSHMFKMLAPEAYQEYENTIINAAEETNRSAVKNRMDFLKDNYGYSEEVIREEIVAELSGGFNSKAMQRMAEGNQTLAAAIADATRTAKAKLRTAFTDGKYTSSTGLQATFEQLNNAEKQLLRGLEKARNNTQINSEVKYSPIETNSKGKYVQADRQVITSKNSADWESEIYNYINDKIRNGQDIVIPTDDGDNLTISEKTAWKMGYRNGIRDIDGNPTKMSDSEYRTKLNAAAHIDELTEISKRGKKNIQDRKNHDFAQDGFNYRTAYFRDLDGKYYKLTISVGENSEQKTVYNIGRIEKVPFPALSGSKASDNVTSAKRNSFNDSIHNTDGNVKYSLKENAGKVDKITSDIIKNNSSTIEKSEIADDVKRIYGLLTDGTVTDEKYQSAWKLAEGVGQSVARGIQFNDSDMYDSYKDLRDTLRSTPISISNADKADITGTDNFNEFRKKNFGSLRITNNGTRIDQFYQELSEQYPNFFDAQRETHPADQLMQIEKVLEDIKPKAHMLSDSEINEAAGDIASNLITDIMNSNSVEIKNKSVSEKQKAAFRKLQQERDWQNILNSEEAQRQENLQTRERQAEFLKGARRGRQEAIDELSQGEKANIHKEAEEFVKNKDIIDEYNAESASRIDKKKFSRHDIVPAIKNYGINFMAREVDKLYPIKSYERFAEKQIHGNEKVRFKGKDSPYVMSSNSIDAESRAKYILTEQLTDFNANPIGESLADIVGDLSYDDYRDFNTYLKLRHGIEWVENSGDDYKPVFANEILNTREAMEAGIRELEAKHSDFAEAAQRIYKYQADLMQAWLVDTGVITQKQFDTLREKYPNYVPFFRQDDAASPRFKPKKGIANQSNPIMEAEGGQQKIYDPIENIMINTSKFVNAAAKNSAMQSVVKIYDSVPGMEHYMAEVVQDAETGKYVLKDKSTQTDTDVEITDNLEEYISDTVQHAIKLTDGDIVTVLENGKKRYFKVFDKAFLNALDNMRPVQTGAVMRAVASATRVFSALATSNNPVFTLASNPIKDTQNAFVQSTHKNPFAVITDILSAQAEQFKNSKTGKWIGQKRNADYDGTDAYKKYMAMGGEYASAFSSGRNAIKETLRDIKPDKKGARAAAGKVVRFIPKTYGKVADAIETGPRLGEFKYSANKAGNDIHQAHFDSKNVTLNFGRSGYVGEKINKFVPFYNPSVQGISTMVQKFKNNPLQTSFRVGVGIALSAIALAWNKRGEESEEAYENASSYLKNNYYLFHIKDGNFLKIPKSQEYGLAPSLIERVVEKYAYENKDAFYNYTDYLSTALLPSIFKAEFPFVDTGSVIGLGTYTSLLDNKDFKGSPIVPDYLQEEVPEKQYDDRTSYIARWIGDALKWSPKKIDYVIKSNTGFLGKINESINHPGEKDWSLGVGTKFTADSLFSTDKVNMFYNNKDNAEKQANSYPDADNEYLKRRFNQTGSILSILNQIYKEDSKSDAGRMVRRTYVNYAKENKDNPTGYSDEVYDSIKNLFDTDSKAVSLPSVDRTIKAKINKEDKSYTFNDADTLLKYQKDLNKNVDEAYRKLLSDISYNAMTNSDKVAALDKAKTEAVKEVKQFYIEHDGKKVMYEADTKTDIVRPNDAELGKYKEKQVYQTKIQGKIQTVAENLAAAVPDKAEDYSAESLKEFDIRSAKIDGKSYDIKGDTLTKVTEAATDEYYANIEKMLNNEINIEDVVGYTSKGKASTATQADGTKVQLTGKLYNDDGSPRFDELTIAKIIRKSKEKSKSNAIEKYRSEITGSDTAQTEEESTKVSKGGSSRKFTSAKASGKKSSGGRKRSSGGRGNSSVRFTSARALLSGRDTARTSRTSFAALPNIMNTNLLRMAASPYVKSKGISDAIKTLENPLFM